MTPAQAKFVELEKQKALVKAYFEKLSEATEELVKEIGVNAYFQDEEGTVYKTCVPDGRFVTYERFSVKRTRRKGERAGDLSLTEATNAGFKVE